MIKYVCTTEEFLENYYSEVYPLTVKDLDFIDEYSLEYLRWDELREHCEEHSAEDPELLSLLADMYTNGKGVEKDEEKGLALLREGEARGSLWCTHRLGVYATDCGLVELEFDEAYRLLEKAVSRGFLPSYNALAWLYVKGCGKPTDRKKALELYGTAAEHGSLCAKYNYAVTVASEDIRTARACMEDAASHGYTPARSWLGMSYLNGIYCKPEYEKAYRHLRKAAECGCEKALYYLGEMYENGYFVEKDHTLAEFCYRNALNGGYSRARGELARMYREMKEPAEGSDDE